MKYIETIQRIIDAFKKYPGVGNKTAERLALYSVVKLSEEEISNFATALLDIKSLKRCHICHNISVNDECIICSDITRNKKIIMVVEQVKDILAIEKTNAFFGVYHVLDGVVNFSSGISSEDINIQSILDRASEAEEIILATNASIEGEITAQYIYEMLKDQPLKITRIAHGIPVGGDLEYADNLTLVKALEGRMTLGKK